MEGATFSRLFLLRRHSALVPTYLMHRNANFFRGILSSIGGADPKFAKIPPLHHFWQKVFDLRSSHPGKVERKIAEVLPKFNHLEHTSQLGIDGLIDIQLRADSVTDLAASAEFEFDLLNFFAHRHPIRQTRYIICWTADSLDSGPHTCGREGIDGGGTIGFEFKGKGWIRTLQFDDHQITVLALKDLPGLRVAS